MKDQREFSALERLLGRMMLAGVTSSAVCLLIGLALFLAAGGPALATVVLTIGLIILMATPAMRVAVAVIESVRMQDWFFAATAVTVILLLGLTLMLSLARVGQAG